jgi:FixJ family two-component response regulator
MNPLRPADGASHVILVVDDDSAVRTSFKFLIEVDGSMAANSTENLRNRSAAAGISIVDKLPLGNHLLDAIRMALDGHPKASS